MFGLGNLSRRLLEGAVGLFALLGFLYVPLGRHTGFEHARAVLGTPAASAAIADVTGSVLALRQRATDFITGRVSPPGRGDDGGGVGAPPSQEKLRNAAPRPVPPKLK